MNEVPAWEKLRAWIPAWASLLDWDKVLTDAEDADIPWLAYPFIEAGTVSSVYCDPKDGKSLAMQLISKQIALGEPVLGTPAREPAPVLYLDYENPDSIVGERYLDMGVNAADLKKYLIYSSFPAIKPLDTPEGGAMLCDLITVVWNAYGKLPALVVIDTLSKTFTGAESSADTFSDIYRHSLLPLRRAKMTVVYLDHSGKDPTAGQRGSSAKPSDVDVVWRLASRKGPRNLIEVVRLEPTHSRTGHVEAFAARVAQEPLRIEIDQVPVSARALEIAGILDGLGVPSGASRAECRTALTEKGIKAKTSDLGEAVKYRKAGGRATQDSSGTAQDSSGTAQGGGDSGGDSPSGTTPGTAGGQRGQTASDLGGQSGDRKNPDQGTTVPLYKRGQAPSPEGYDLFSDTSEWGKLYSIAALQYRKEREAKEEAKKKREAKKKA
jgi:hypothetical protein